VERTAATPQTAAVRFTDVTVRFVTSRKTTDAVGGVSLDVAPGEFVAILGPSGCGKSTLLKVAAGLVRASHGTAELLGRKVAGPQRDIGFVFQRAALLEWRSTRANILLQAEIRRMDRREAELMDEPFGALDALTREQMNVELHRIWLETGTSVLFVTHSIPEAIYLANRVVVMTARPGRIAEIFPIDLPARRDYGETMASTQLTTLAERARDLLGASAHRE
jgi:NitT/TauT family transport system ATP-binding protein